MLHPSPVKLKTPSSMPDSQPPACSGAAEPVVANRPLPWQLMEQVLDLSSECVLCVDRDWRLSYLNRAARVLLQRDDLVGEHLWTEYPATLAEPFESHYRAAMDEGVMVEFEAFGPSVRRWMKVRVQPFGGGIVIFSTDVSDRKRAEEIRDANARHLEQVLEAITDAVVSFDRDFRYTFLNHQAEALLGRSDLLGKNVFQEFPPTSADPYLRRTMEDRTACEFEVYNPPPLSRWFSVQSRPSEDGIVVFFRDVDEERRARQELLAEQATLAFVQEAARVATWVVDLGAAEIRFSSGSYPVFGVPNRTIQTLEDIRRIVLPEDLAHYRLSGRRAAQATGVSTVDYRVVAPDGSIVWLEGRCVRVCDAHGSPTHLRGMTTDITARKQNEERLAASEAQYRVLTDLNPQSLWMGDASGRVIYANQEFVEYLGMPHEELLIDGGWLRGFDPADKEHVMEVWSQSVATGADYAVEARIIRGSDGASRWWFLRALPVRDPSGKILHWLGVAHDIQDAKTAAAELRWKQEETERQRAELETVYKTAPIGLALFDPVEFRYLRLNDRQAQIVGLPPERIVGSRVTDLAPIPGLHEMFAQVATGVPITDQLLEGELAMMPGEYRYWNVNYFPVYAPDGTVRAITAASLEITHQKKAELALIQSEKLAAVGRLASSISHEINNPLEAITNLLYLVATDVKLPEEVKVYVHMAQSELSRVSQIATQTLRFHRQAVRRTMVTAGELVGAVLGLYHGRLSNSGIRVEAVYASKTLILCLENDIRQVLNNLIANAIDAMRTGGRLVVRAHNATDWAGNAEQARKGVRITIADTGHGMPPAVKARVFEAFYTTKDLNGTGLGLWISLGIVQHHRGRLTIRSSQDPRHAGTVFTLFLPLAEEAA